MANGATRDLAKEAYWRRMTGRQADSGLSVRGWCHKHGLNEATFHWWRRELGRRDAEGRPSARRGVTKQSMPFLPVHVTEEGPGAPDSRIDIVLPDGPCVRVHGSVDRRTLADVLAVLEQRGC